jgi:hypothetical protein
VEVVKDSKGIYTLKPVAAPGDSGMKPPPDNPKPVATESVDRG